MAWRKETFYFTDASSWLDIEKSRALFPRPYIFLSECYQTARDFYLAKFIRKLNVSLVVYVVSDSLKSIIGFV
jgi:hypothetical protein